MAKNALFRNSLGGYNKEDVQQYIDDLNVRFCDREDELEAEIKSLKKELEILPELKAEKQKAQELEKENELLKKENSDLSEAIKAQGDKIEEKEEELLKLGIEKEDLSKKFDEITKKFDELTKKYDELYSQKTLLQSECDEKLRRQKALCEDAEALKRELEFEKADFERRAEDMLGEIQSQAEQVIEKANETAELIVANAKKKAEQSAVRPVRNDYASHSSYDKKKDNLSDMLDSHKSKMDGFFSSIVKAIRGDNR